MRALTSARTLRLNDYGARADFDCVPFVIAQSTLRACRGGASEPYGALGHRDYTLRVWRALRVQALYKYESSVCTGEASWSTWLHHKHSLHSTASAFRGTENEFVNPNFENIPPSHLRVPVDYFNCQPLHIVIRLNGLLYQNSEYEQFQIFEIDA